MSVRDGHSLPIFASASAGGWLFGRSADLWIFGGSAALSGVLLLIGARLHLLHADAPDWVWLLCIVGIDVAHVWSTLFRVYFDREALHGKPLLYLGVPVVCYAAGVMAHAFSAAFFWRVLAYVAVFHFTRQQVGFVSLVSRRGPPQPEWERLLDRTTVYAVTLHPIVVWHTRLPEPFAWFMQGDFVMGVPAWMARITELGMIFALALFFCRQGWLFLQRRGSLTKTLIVITTFACWYGGIVVLASDFAFTVTNVVIHGVPYMALTYRYARAQRHKPSIAAALLRAGVVGFAGVCLALAWLEEGAWDRFIWHEHADWFGSGAELASERLLWLVPLLALPQLTHYVLDGLVWHVRDPESVLRRELESP